ncbi:MAG: ROK family protein [Anaerolineae bacterium]|nr:ROK family protein [Anaerolineae bacterium]NUQ02799.1 ROK family protein [Anaerolineae bacterium]
MAVLGIDIGGTGIKAAPVDTEKGILLAERFRVETPSPSTVAAVTPLIQDILHHFEWHDEVGCGYPGVIKRGTIFTAANVDSTWVGLDASTFFEQVTGCPTYMINDADAAGLAEMHFGAGVDQRGVVLVLTIGTGIGTALFVEGRLVPNLELGHLQIRGKDAEHRASNRVRVDRELTWKKWARRVNEYLMHVENLLWPDLIIIGGGISKSFSKFAPHLVTRAPVVCAKTYNDAGIIGAAMTSAHPESTGVARG